MEEPTPFTRVPRIYHDVAPTNQSMETPDKANAIFMAGVNLALRDDDPDYPALVLGNYILGGGTLYSRLGNRIRQKEGLSYGVGSNVQASAFDKTGAFTTFAIYAPQNAAKLETAFKEEVDKAVKEGFTPAEIAEAKKGLLESRKLGRAQDAGLSRTLAAELFTNRTLAWDAAMDKKISDLTAEQVNAAMQEVDRSVEDHDRQGGRFREVCGCCAEVVVKGFSRGGAEMRSVFRDLRVFA